MADGISMKYDIMDSVCNELTAIVGEMVSNKETMMDKVNYMCETWVSEASQNNQEEFAAVGKQIDTLSSLAEELIANVKNYRADMEALDHSYA
ncbi:MAG: hypothetical protein J1F18_03535 [Lachnospiraceae bacterium]|nr:hypothetical protein [Lachnospiraceae bacterium]